MPIISSKVLTLLRCDLSSFGLGRLVSQLEILLLFKLRGAMGGLVLTGLNFKLCLESNFIPGEDSGVDLCRDPVPPCPADNSGANWATAEVCGEMQGWSSSGGSTADTW